MKTVEDILIENGFCEEEDRGRIIKKEYNTKYYSEEEIKEKLNSIRDLDIGMIELNEIICENKLFNFLFGDEE